MQKCVSLSACLDVCNVRLSSHGEIRLMRSLVTSIFLYACESWTLTAELQRRMNAMVTRCSRKILHISYNDHVTNEEVMPRSSRQLDHTKIWRSQRDANCSGMVMFPVHKVWPKPSCKAQWKREEDKADKGRGGKITSGNGQAWSSASPRGQWRTGENGENWLQNHLWCPNDPRG